MTSRPEIVFQPLNADLEPTVLVLAGDDVALGSRGRDLDQRSGGALLKAAEAAQYKGRKKATVEVLAPPRLGGVNRVILLGSGKTGELKRERLGAARRLGGRRHRRPQDEDGKPHRRSGGSRRSPSPRRSPRCSPSAPRCATTSSAST